MKLVGRGQCSWLQSVGSSPSSEDRGLWETTGAVCKGSEQKPGGPQQTAAYSNGFPDGIPGLDHHKVTRVFPTMFSYRHFPRDSFGGPFMLFIPLYSPTSTPLLTYLTLPAPLFPFNL